MSALEVTGIVVGALLVHVTISCVVTGYLTHLHSIDDKDNESYFGLFALSFFAWPIVFIVFGCKNAAVYFNAKFDARADRRSAAKRTNLPRARAL